MIRPVTVTPFRNATSTRRIAGRAQKEPCEPAAGRIEQKTRFALSRTLGPSAGPIANFLLSLSQIARCEFMHVGWTADGASTAKPMPAHLSNC